MKLDTKSNILDYLKDLKQVHSEDYYNNMKNCEDNESDYELGYIQCLKDLIKTLSK